MLRRDLLLGGMALSALGASEALRPRNRMILLKNTTIAAALPTTFAGWESEDANLINPAMAGRLARSLYSEMVSRTYHRGDNAVMVLIAYGDTQSDLLQLHRPESCYPAVGYAIEYSRKAELPIGRGLALPGRRVIAASREVNENIAYWTRLGERLPQSGSDQRVARLENAMDGYVPDGVLVRCSVLGDAAPSFALLNQFIPTMLHAVAPAALPAFIGTDLARRVA